MDKKCEECNGTGFLAFEHATTSDDWVICELCSGTGSIAIYNESEEKNGRIRKTN